MVKKTTFLKGNLCIYKCFREVSYIFSSALKKNYKMRPDLRWILCWILPCAQPMRIHVPDSVTRIALKD